MINMNEYQVGKDIMELQQRVAHLENILNQMLQQEPKEEDRGR